MKCAVRELIKTFAPEPKKKSKMARVFSGSCPSTKVLTAIHPSPVRMIVAFIFPFYVAIIIGYFLDTGLARTCPRLAGLEEAGRESGRTWERVSSIRGRAWSAVCAACESAAAAAAEEEEEGDDDDDDDERSGRSTQTFQSRAKAANAAVSCQP